MTSQEVFDQIVSHLRKQNCRSTASPSSTACMYRGSNGMKCAVGCMIPDEDYDPSMERKAVRALVHMFKCLGNLTQHINLLSYMQAIHDSTSVEKWEQAFQLAAMHFRLKYTFT